MWSRISRSASGSPAKGSFSGRGRSRKRKGPPERPLVNGETDLGGLAQDLGAGQQDDRLVRVLGGRALDLDLLLAVLGLAGELVEGLVTDDRVEIAAVGLEHGLAFLGLVQVAV